MNQNSTTPLVTLLALPEHEEELSLEWPRRTPLPALLVWEEALAGARSSANGSLCVLRSDGTHSDLFLSKDSS